MNLLEKNIFRLSGLDFVDIEISHEEENLRNLLEQVLTTNKSVALVNCETVQWGLDKMIISETILGGELKLNDFRSVNVSLVGYLENEERLTTLTVDELEVIISEEGIISGEYPELFLDEDTIKEIESWVSATTWTKECTDLALETVEADYL
jgi:hypothetical protein